MELSKAQKEKLKTLDLIEASQEARIEANRLINDQGFSIFAILISNIIAEMAEHPEKLIREFAA
jgi:hypothetical protein